MNHNLKGEIFLNHRIITLSNIFKCIKKTRFKKYSKKLKNGKENVITKNIRFFFRKVNFLVNSIKKIAHFTEEFNKSEKSYWVSTLKCRSLNTEIMKVRKSFFNLLTI